MSQRPNRLCVDLDNVIADTDRILRKLIRDSTNGRVDLDYTDIIDFNYYSCKDRNGNFISEEDWSAVHRTFSESPNILSIRPANGVRESLNELSFKYEIHIVTTRMPKAWISTVEWLTNNAIPHHALHFVGHRRKHESLRGFCLAVEDDYDQAVNFVDAGTPCYLLRHPWNNRKQPINGLQWVEDWNELEQRLQEAKIADGGSPKSYGTK